MSGPGGAGDRPGARALRRDAAANRERVLAAAVTAMLREGRQVPMAAIAAEAGVGVGTLYRRYPDRDALLADLTIRAFRLLADLVEQAEPGPGTAADRLDGYWSAVVEHRDQLVLPLHGGPPVTAAAAAEQQARLHAGIARLLAAGRSDGSLRDDLTVGDLVTFGAMLVAPLPGAADWPERAARQRRLHLDGLRPRGR